MRTPPRHVVPVILYAILAILVIPVFPHYVSPNEFSRWDLAVAIVDFHTIEVTRAVAATNTENEDLSAIDGRKYSNKAPGAAFVGLPAYAFARWIVGPPSPHNMRVTLTAIRLLGSTLPAILLALFVAATAIRSVQAKIVQRSWLSPCCSARRCSHTGSCFSRMRFLPSHCSQRS